ncbi:MAG: hypothetical protein MJ239_00950 [Bacilli bacterium]|nr:hypothetical protein [Bacilli bacterium]
MKGKTTLFSFVGAAKKFRLILDIQTFAAKRVSDRGIAIQESVNNQRLKNLVGELYREGAEVGDGSAMAAASKQVKTGELVGGRNHIIKIEQRIVNLQRILAKEELSPTDRAFGERLLSKMEKSLKGEY